jgi:hypothetical protein
MIQHLELFSALAQPFEADEVRVRPQGGRQLQYITARTVMNRLDDVLGPANWSDEYLPQEHSVICRLTIRLPDGTTLTKSDAGGYAGMSDSGDDDKSGFSDAFKRAAVKFGIGRYLYRDGVPRFLREQAQHTHPAADAHRSGRDAPSPPDPRPEADDQGGGLPQTGKALFAWIKQQEERLGPGLLRSISEWGQCEEFPARMVQWNAEQVRRGHAEACKVIRRAPESAQAVEPPTRDARNGHGEPQGRGKAETAAGARSGAAQKGDHEPAPSRSSRSRS